MTLTQQILDRSSEIEAARAWFAARYDPSKIAATVQVAGDGKYSALVCLPPMSQTALNALLTLAQTISEAPQ